MLSACGSSGESKILGLKSKNCKRMAKGAKTNEPNDIVSLIKQKREGPTPLNDLDPNALD